MICCIEFHETSSGQWTYFLCKVLRFYQNIMDVNGLEYVCVVYL